MDFSTVDLAPEQQRFAEELRGFLDAIMTPAVHDHERLTGDGFNEEVHLALGSRGWLFPAWAVEEGGAGLDPVCGRILELELQRYQVPDVTLSTTALVWEAIAQLADAELAAELKPEVAAGRVRFCLGYTDPEGGSDAAAAHLRAVRDGSGGTPANGGVAGGGQWVLNGAKMFTTGAHNSQYTFLITRTDVELPKHKGLTMFLVPLDLPGVEIQAIRTYGGERTNAVYYADVRVPDRYRMGGVNRGWAALRGPLGSEHGAGATDGLADVSKGRNYLREFERALDATVAWATGSTRPDGTRAADDPVFLDRLGRQIIELEAGIVTPGIMGRVKGSMVLIEGAPELMELVGPESVLAHGAAGAVADGRLDFSHRWAQGTATYGGTTEVFKNMIAQHVLGLPRATYPGSKALVR